MTGEKDPRDVMQAEHDAGLSEHPAFRAPAEMPGVEVIARLLFQRSVYHGYDADTLKREWIRTEGLHRGNARAVLDLFAPILAEKDGYKEIIRQAAEARDAAGYIGAVWDCIDDLSARALAAEAALAETRAEYQSLRAVYDASLEMWGQHAAAIRAQGE